MKHLALLSFLALASACTNVRESMGIHHADITMSRSQFDFINNCEALAEAFPGCACQQGWGEDDYSTLARHYGYPSAEHEIPDGAFPASPDQPDPSAARDAAERRPSFGPWHG